MLKTIGMLCAALAVCAALAAAALCAGCGAGGDDEDTLSVSDHERCEFTDNLPAGLDAASHDTLIARAATNEDYAWIVTHGADFGIDGETVQLKTLKLAADEPAALSFCRNFCAEFLHEAGDPYTGTLTKGTFPHLYQWDPAWGYTEFCTTAFGLTGCCPTAFSMVVMAYTGDASHTPYEMGKLARSMGYVAKYAGTDGAFIVAAAPKFGFSAQGRGLDGAGVMAALKAGSCIIANVGPGDFTTGGHYILLTGVTEDGKVRVNDPYSAVRSARTWDADVIVNQTKRFFVCTPGA